MSRLNNLYLFLNDEKGRTLPRAKLFFYENNSFDFKNTYADKALTSVNPNPVIADGAGRFPNIFLEADTYRVVLQDEDGVEISTKDDVDNLLSDGDNVSNTTVTTSTGSQTVAGALDDRQISVSDVSALPDVVADVSAYVDGYQPSTKIGGGSFTGVALARHDGIVYIDPDRAFPTDWEDTAQVAAWFANSGSDAPCWARVNVSYLSPETAGAFGDGILNDAAQIQQATFFADSLGVPLILESDDYYFKEYLSSWDGNLLRAGGATVAKIWQLPYTGFVGSNTQARVKLEGGSSTPFGFGTSANVLLFPGGESIIQVSSATNSTRGCVVADTTGLSVGQQVILGREGGQISAGVPRTPSQERAPMQFLTIKSIDPGTKIVIFEEAFIHDFESVSSDLELYYVTAGRSYPSELTIENITFSRVDPASYVLFSRFYGLYLDNVNFKDTLFGFGSAQKLVIGTLETNVLTDSLEGTVESISDIYIDNVVATSDFNSNLGGLYFGDNVRQLRINKYTANRFAKTALGMLYSVEASIGFVELVDCGEAAVLDSFHAALTVGMPNQGIYGSRTVAESPAYLCQNHSGNSKITIENLVIRGPNTAIAVRCHDADLQIGRADIEYNNASSTVGPILVGESKERRADATYYPEGGRSSVYIDRLIANGDEKKSVIVASSGFNSLFKGGDSLSVGLTSSGATSITVEDGTQFRSNDVIYFIDDSITGISPSARQVSGVSGNVLTVTVGIPGDLPAGSGVWRSRTSTSKQNVDASIQNIKFNDLFRTSIFRDIEIYPDFQTGVGPYTDDIDITVPTDGTYILDIYCVSNDNAHSDHVRYTVTLDTTNGTFPINSIVEERLDKMRTNATVDSAVFSSAGVITVTVGSASIGKTAFVNYQLKPKL